MVVLVVVGIEVAFRLWRVGDGHGGTCSGDVDGGIFDDDGGDGHGNVDGRSGWIDGCGVCGIRMNRGVHSHGRGGMTIIN